ncbi:MAG TPA: cystatin domain-containing protein [Pyrinomonadaceae bacterium]|jgi:cystatin-C|nr:cystatin domain-containing protein [Pyrinomonadaceae bacterium]
MKKLLPGVITALFMLVVAFVAGASAQSDPVVGGYGAVSIKDRLVKQAASVAVRDHARKDGHSLSLIRIVKAEQQVVSGMNYKMCLRVRRPGHKAHNATAVVYQPIRKRMRLTDWTEGCQD